LSMAAATAAVVAPNCDVTRPVYGEVVSLPVSVVMPSSCRVTAVAAPSLINRKGDPTNATHESPDARATAVLQTPLVGVGTSKDVNEKSSPPPSRTINGLMLPAGRSLMVPVPEVNVPPEKLMLVGRPVAMHPSFVPAEGSQVIVVAVIVKPPPGVQFVKLAVPVGSASAEPASVKQSKPREPIKRKNFARRFTIPSCDYLSLPRGLNRRQSTTT